MVDISGDVDDCYQKQLHYYQLGGGEEKPLDTWGRRGGGEGEEEREREEERGREGERERGREEEERKKVQR